MKMGFSGSRHGMTQAQLDTLGALLVTRQPEEFHHGLCLGADAQAHELVRMLDMGAAIHGHPPEDGRLLANLRCDQLWQPLPYLKRNRAIVKATDLLVATPSGTEREQPRSGTWATIRYAGAAALIIDPLGRILD